jgi:bifunctional DNase/RNase
VIVTTIADTGFVEMLLGKVVGITTEEGGASCCVVLEAVSGAEHLPIQIGRTEAFNLSARLTGWRLPIR